MTYLRDHTDDKALTVMREQAMAMRRFHTTLIALADGMPVEKKQPLIDKWTDDIREWELAITAINDEIERRELK